MELVYEIVKFNEPQMTQAPSPDSEKTVVVLCPYGMKLCGSYFQSWFVNLRFSVF